MPTRPENPQDLNKILLDMRREIRELQRVRLQLPEDSDALQTYEDGQLLGDTRFLNFGAGINASLVGDDYVLVTGSGGGQSPFDAIVDGTLTASIPSDRLFIGIGEALEYLRNTVGLVDACAVAVRPYPGSETAGYVETADWSMPTNTRLYGLRGAGPRIVGANNLVAWTWDGFKPSNGTSIQVENFGHFQPAGYGAVTPIATLLAYNTYFDIESVDAAALCASFFGVNCIFDIRAANGETSRFSSGSAYFVDCSVSLRRISSGTFTWIPAATGPWVMTKCGLNYTSGHASPTVILPVKFDLELTDNHVNKIVTGAIPILTVPASAKGRIHIRSEDFFGAPTINATSAFVALEIEGNPGALTLTGAHDNLHIRASNSGEVWDIRGPALLDVDTTAGGRYIFRGDGLSGTIAGDALTGSGTFLSFIAADDCAFIVGADGSASTKVAYAFDASSDNNVLLFQSRSTFTVGTDAGTLNRVLPEGSSPPAGGIAPANADYLVGTANADLSAEIVVGTTPGGELGNTWAAPTVDALHSGSAHADFLPVAGAPTGWGSVTNVTPDQAYDADSTTVNELADVLGTLIADLVARGVLDA